MAMRIYQARLRKLHPVLAPVMILPILLTLIIGSIYQIVDLGGKGGGILTGCWIGTKVTLASST